MSKVERVTEIRKSLNTIANLLIQTRKSENNLKQPEHPTQRKQPKQTKQNLGENRLQPQTN